ncbi:hypothetical protein NADFUDRAFT_80961, partial [Nadsonia fulvescens var. elongata DSM 6958]
MPNNYHQRTQSLPEHPDDVESSFSGPRVTSSSSDTGLDSAKASHISSDPVNIPACSAPSSMPLPFSASPQVDMQGSIYGNTRGRKSQRPESADSAYSNNTGGAFVPRTQHQRHSTQRFSIHEVAPLSSSPIMGGSLEKLSYMSNNPIISVDDHSTTSDPYRTYSDTSNAAYSSDHNGDTALSLSPSEWSGTTSLQPQSRSRELSPSSTLRKSSSPVRQPFNFQPATYTSASVKPSQRKGHRYKRSSVSMNFFQEPPNRAPLAIPASLPIPNLKECYQSISTEQKIRMIWCLCHCFVAFIIFTTKTPFSALSALAHLIFYDAMGALLCVAVDILGNFDVWKQSSIHHPFGLERVEVLAGFALSVTLLFMGGDIMSHSIEHLVSSVYSNSADGISSHHEHSHSFSENDSEIRWGKIIFRVVVAMMTTIISALGLNNHARISKALRSSTLSSLPSIFSNPSHLMTVTFCMVILLFPFCSPTIREYANTILTPLIAGSMCYVGWNLAKATGGMLVMSFPGLNLIGEIERDILADPHVKSVKDISFWQVHHGLCLASMKITMNSKVKTAIGTQSCTDRDEQKLKDKARSIIKNILG